VELVVDASVAVKWFVIEKASEAARRLLDDFAAEDVGLHAPALLPFEVLNALRFTSLLSEERALQAAVALERLGLQYHPLEGEFGRRAVHMAYADDLTLYDAAYLALAKQMSTRVVTADAGLARAGGPGAIPLEDYAGVSPS